MFAIAFWYSDSTFTVMSLESIRTPRKELHKYQVGDKVEALYKNKLLSCRLYEIGEDRSVLNRKLNKGFKLDLEVLLEKDAQSSEQPRNDESNESVKERIQSGTAVPVVGKKNQSKSPTVKKVVPKKKRTASSRGKENTLSRQQNKKQKKDINSNDSFSDEYPEEHDLSYSILKMRRENKSNPAPIKSAQQENPPPPSEPLHQIPLQTQPSPCSQQQVQSQPHHQLQQQSTCTPTNQQQQTVIQQQHVQQLSAQHLTKQQQSSINHQQTQQQHPQIQQECSTQQWPTQQQEHVAQQQSSSQQWPGHRQIPIQHYSAQQYPSSLQWPAQKQQSATQQWQTQNQPTPTPQKHPQSQQQQFSANQSPSLLQNHKDVATQQSRIEDTSISGVFRDAMDTVNDYTYDEIEFTGMSTSTPTHRPGGNIHQSSSAETPQKVSTCHDCCRKLEFLTKELIELRQQVQQLQGRKKLPNNRCNSSPMMSDEPAEVQQSEPCSPQLVGSNDNQHVATENKENLKEIIKNAIGNEKRIAHATRKAMKSVFTLAQLTTCTMRGLHTNKNCSSPRPGLPVVRRIAVQEVLAEVFDISEETAFTKMRESLRSFENQWSGLDIPQ